MDVPMYSLAERDRRWALARKLMAAEEVDALIACGGYKCAGRAVSLGGTVLIGEDDSVELSPFTARMLRVPVAYGQEEK